MTCPSCGTENEPGRKFCGECGSPLARVCPSCGTPNGATAKFCGECGAALTGQAPAAAVQVSASPVARVAAAPAAERRLVSVLFADLVGFTTLSESRDPEEVRELLSRYFETSRQLIARYGGVVEKFIGDAVMAVWGTPVAMEDDAERAVRAALDLVGAVAALGQEVNAPDLRARAGVLTGEAAVTIGAEGQGMVAGDLVNTASRIQSAAEPGAVFVGDTTRRSSEASVAYEDAGSHELKGKSEPMQLWRAVRIVAGKGGSMRTTGLEAPFVGRDRELRLVKELYHAAAEEKRAHLVSVVGIGGIGKSRLSWEFEKYMDGLAHDMWWHRGRCLAYGEGVAYWALAEMVRMRAGMVEGEDADASITKLRASIAEFVKDPEERRWVEPRLAHLLGLEERMARDQADLFSAWRLFFERISETDPTVLVFEDLQWADSGLLDFIEYVLEWSKDHPLFILTLGRPELSDRRPTWGAGKRNFTSIYLEPLSSDAMEQLLDGLVPGLPDEVRNRILARAEGVPLYAVETVRMLLDRGVLKKENGQFHVTGEVGDLEVPETLHALIAARLDGLTSEERWLLQDASVMGKTFSKGGLAAVTSIAGTELDTLLTSLVRKEVLQVQADPRSPERGQYGFVQDLVKRVAYDTLSKKERKAKHLAVAAYLKSDSGYDEEEIVEVVASHYVQAYEAAPDADDAGEIKENARRMLAAAGEHAAALAANEEAQRYFEQAAGLADEQTTRAELLERAGVMARIGGRADEASVHFEKAIELFESAGHSHPAARVSARLGEVMWDKGRLGEAVERMDRSFLEASTGKPDEDLAALAAQLGRFLFFSGHTDQSLERIEYALEAAEALWIPEVLSQALNTKGVILNAKGRRAESMALMRFALQVALDNDAPTAALRAYYNLSDLAAHADRYQESSDLVRSGITLARRVGVQVWEWSLLSQIYPLYALGEWDEALEMIGQIPEDKLEETRASATGFLGISVALHVQRGDLEEAKRHLTIVPGFAISDDFQERAIYQLATANTALASDDPAAALEAAERSFGARDALSVTHETIKEAAVVAMDAALALERVDKVEELLSFIEDLPRGSSPQYLEAHALRFRSRLAAREGRGDDVEQGFKGAVGMFREMATPFPMAQTLLEHGEWLVQQGRATDPESLFLEAHEIFERLKAKPWLERLERLAPTPFAAAES